MLVELGAGPALGALGHDLERGALQLGLELGNQALGELAQAASALREAPPLLGGEQPERRRRLIRADGLPEAQQRDDGGPGVDVRRQQTRLLRKGIDEGALAGLDLTDHRDAARPLLQQTLAFHQERMGVLVEVVAQLHGKPHQPTAHVLQGTTDLARRLGSAPRAIHTDGARQCRW